MPVDSLAAKAQAIEQIQPRSLKYLSEHLQILIRGRLWAQVLIGMVLGLATGIMLGPTVGWVAPATATTISSWLGPRRQRRCRPAPQDRIARGTLLRRHDDRRHHDRPYNRIPRQTRSVCRQRDGADRTQRAPAGDNPGRRRTAHPRRASAQDPDASAHQSARLNGGKRHDACRHLRYGHRCRPRRVPP